ncbi:MAG: ATPase, T2SS/T4P/T4SS family, partial [Planctomycetota bacterium]|nr:ATPase, T2SS/T4P/T4SS family [Planctomycetota bacterium]
MATIIDILIDMDLISEEDVEEADQYCAKNGGEPHDALLSLNYVTEEDILFAIGSQTGMDVIDLDNEEISPEVVDQVPKNIAFVHRVMPVAEEDGVVIIALSDPMNAAVLDDLSFMLNKEIRGAISSPDSIDAAIEKYYGAAEDQTMDDALSELGIDVDNMAVVEEGGGQDLENIESASQSAPVVKLLNLILLQAIKDKAADIHLEPFEKEFKVRQRIDGVLYEIMKPPVHLAPALASRVKVMAGLDISERRLPQAGRIELKVGGRPVDIRVS